MSAAALLASYFLLGCSSLLLFDLKTKRLRTGFRRAVSDTQFALMGNGTVVRDRTAGILLAGAIVLFWPAVFLGALLNRKGDKHGT